MAERDVIIIGGGPAGLSAALILGRCRRRVTLFDDGQARNNASRGVHGFLTHDGISPKDFRARARRELARYEVDLREERIVDAKRNDREFQVRDARGTPLTSRMLLLATGVEDAIPSIPGARDLYGRGVYPCPYCDGWEFRDRALGAYASGDASADFALGLTTWSRDVILFTDGGPLPPESELARLSRYGVELCHERLSRFEGSEHGLRAIHLRNGKSVARDALFLHTRQYALSTLAESLGCSLEAPNALRTHDRQRTEVPGLYVAGDAAMDVKFAIVAAGHGARAAHDINQALRKEATE